MEDRSNSVARLLQSAEAFERLPLAVSTYAATVNLHASPADGMLVPDGDTHYLGVGATALNAVLAAIALGDQPVPEALLDFGAGAGRVLRWLRAAFPNASIDACDLREQDMSFCAAQFDAKTWTSGTDIKSLHAPGNYGLIWAGSVLTHLPPLSCVQLLDKFLSWCVPNGLIVFSTMGRLPAGRPNGREDYHYAWESIRKQYSKEGFGFADYHPGSGYGIAIAKPSWYMDLIERHKNVRLIMLAEAVWDNHHDVWAIQRRPIDTIMNSTYLEDSSAYSGAKDSGYSFETLHLSRRDSFPKNVIKLLSGAR